jgi:hypothetical protein
VGSGGKVNLQNVGPTAKCLGLYLFPFGCLYKFVFQIVWVDGRNCAEIGGDQAFLFLGKC